MQSLDRSHGLVDFLTKRAARIFPGLVVAVVAIVFVLGPIVSNVKMADYFADSRTYSYLQNVGLFIIYQLPGVFESLPLASVVNGSLWTIPVEVECYIILGFLLVKVRSRVSRAATLVLVCFILILVIEQWVSEKNFFVFYGTDWIISSTIMIFFFVGAFLYVIPRHLLRLDLGLLLVFCSMLLGEAPLNLSVIQPIFITYAIVCLGNSRSLLPKRVIALGDPSYGAYLYAFPIQQVVIHLGVFSTEIHINIFLVSVLSFGLGYLSWHLIEKPAVLGARRFLAKRAGGLSSY